MKSVEPISIQTLIRRALKRAPMTQTELIREVLGERYEWNDWLRFGEAWAWLKTDPCEVAEVRVQVPGTGHEAVPSFETRWALRT